MPDDAPDASYSVKAPSSPRRNLRRKSKGQDFAVDHSGHWWFLEINESGQFLWIDQMLPNAGVFEDFLAFLTGVERQSFPSLRDFTFDLSTIPERTVEKPEQVTVER
jgi:hypothetical protein